MRELDFRHIWMWTDRYLIVVWTHQDDGSFYLTTTTLYNENEISTLGIPMSI